MGSGIMTFTDGQVLTAAQVNGYLMRQALVTCTSGTRPASPTTGQPIYETDTKLIRIWDGSSWYCPLSPDYVDFSGSVVFYSNIVSGTTISGGSVSVTYARYRKVNTNVHYYGHATINTTTANGFGLSLPFPLSFRSFSMSSVSLHGGSTTTYADCPGDGHVPGISAPYNRFGPVKLNNALGDILTSGHTVHWNVTYESA